jgi:beta-galactosidase
MDTMDIAGYNYIDRYFPGLYADKHKKFPERILLGTETFADLKNWLSIRDHPYVTGEFLWVGIDYQGEAVKLATKGMGMGSDRSCRL